MVKETRVHAFDKLFLRKFRWFLVASHSGQQVTENWCGETDLGWANRMNGNQIKNSV